MTETGADLRDAFRDHLQLTSLRDAYDRLLAETRLQPEFDDSDPKVKVVFLRSDDCIPYQLELYKWGLCLTIGEPARETWARLGDAPHGHFWPRFVKPETDEEADKEADDPHPGFPHRVGFRCRGHHRLLTTHQLRSYLFSGVVS